MMLRLTPNTVRAVLWAAFIAAAPAAGAEPSLSLSEAVQQALDSSVPLASQRRALAADRESVGLARSPLLPQVTVGGVAQAIDSERSDSNRGNVSEESATLQAQLSQVLYDEDHWAQFQAQQHTFDQQRQQFESFRLSIVQETAVSFFELERSQAQLTIQQENREVTRKNLETTRVRVATGYSSERELLRWQSQLAHNDIDVEQALTAVLSSRFELNRVRSRAPEEGVEPVRSSADAQGFVYARSVIAQALEAPGADEKLRDYLARVGLGRSPTLRALDAAIAAQERIVTAKERAFWIPSLSLLAGADHLVDDGGSGSDFRETEWGVGVQLVFPIFQGGAKPAALRQAREARGSLRLERRAQAESLEQGIRTAFAQASGAYRGLGHAREQEAAATKNYDLVNEAYVLGVADYLDLLDAQNQSLSAQVTSLNALYDFLESLIDAETQIAFFPFLEEPSDVEALLQGLERSLGQP